MIKNWSYSSSLDLLKKSLLLALLFSLSTSLVAQEYIRCSSVEAEQTRLDDRYQEYFDLFEAYINQEKNRLNAESVNNYTIPVVFHIIHDNDALGTGDNIATQYINSQLEQLNNDFRKIMGTSGDGGGIDTGIEFCAALVDEDGNLLAEPGINRIDRNNEGWTAPPYGTPVVGCLFGANLDYIDNTIKPQSQWDPEQYMNIWVLDMVCGILGYAQFPEAASLPGIGTGNGGASSDGVVVLPGSVGSTDNPLPPASGGAVPFNEGRTLTHEVGHFFGLRHIWGDGDCNADDFCADTPAASTSTSGCPGNKDSCPGGGSDQIENYMDYSDDFCMDRFTVDQTDRMQIVMGATGVGSVRREILASSTVCDDPNTNECELDLMVDAVPITAETYKATNTITSEGTVATGTIVTFEAGQSITLEENFVAENGSTFTARIQDCVANVAPNQDEEVENRTQNIVADNALNVFPNPSNGQTNITVAVQEANTVSVELFDLNGRKIANIAAVNYQMTGEYNYSFNTSNLNSGIYVVVVRVGEQTLVKKLSVL